MKNIWLIPLALASTFGYAFAADYRVVSRIKVPDGSFDYATFNPASGQVFMPRGTFTTVVDVKTNDVSQLSNGASDHIALPVPGSTLLVLTQRSGTIRILDAAKDAAVIDLKGGSNPNSAAYDPVSRNVLVFNKASGDATLVDPRQGEAVATIPISKNTLEFPVADGKGVIYDNVETTGEIAVIDVAARKVRNFLKLNGCESPSGLAYDGSDNLLISACANGVAKVIAAGTGKEVASLPIGHGPDAVIFDPNRKMAFVPCGIDGVLEVISLSNQAHISVVQHLATQPGSRTGTIDPATGKIYLMASNPDTNAKVPPGSRVPRLAGSWEVLVVQP